MLKSFPFFSQGNIGEFEKKCFKSGNCNDLREKMGSLLYCASCPNSVCTDSLAVVAFQCGNRSLSILKMT